MCSAFRKCKAPRSVCGKNSLINLYACVVYYFVNNSNDDERLTFAGLQTNHQKTSIRIYEFNLLFVLFLCKIWEWWMTQWFHLYISLSRRKKVCFIFLVWKDDFGSIILQSKWERCVARPENENPHKGALIFFWYSLINMYACFMYCFWYNGWISNLIGITAKWNLVSFLSPHTQ